jgi:hypothetical protein
MFAKFLDIENDGAYEFIHEPQLPQIARAIAALDGNTKTVVCIEGEMKAHMDIGGGAAQGCVVALSYDNSKFYIVINPAAAGEHIDVKVGGDPRPYPAEMLVSKDIALKAAKTFAETGAAEPSIHWRDTSDVKPKES